MAKQKNKRAHSRHNIIHLKIGKFNYEGEQYPMVDISYGGFSILDKDWELSLYKKSKVENAHIEIGPLGFDFNIEVVAVDNVHRMLGIRINKHHAKSKKYWKLITSGIEEGALDKNTPVERDGNGLLVTAKKFSVHIADGKIKVLKKGMFVKEDEIPYIVLGIIMGLPRKEYPSKDFIQPVLDILKSSIEE